jgi:MoxR-like ATPase
MDGKLRRKLLMTEVNQQIDENTLPKKKTNVRLKKTQIMMPQNFAEMKKISDGIRTKLRKAMQLIINEKLFVPPSYDFLIEGKRYASTVLLPFANLCVNHGAMLLYGGKGGGKTTMAMLMGHIACGKWLKTSFHLLQGDPETSRNEIVGSLNPQKFQQGTLEVMWSEFLKHPIKIIDELNRMSSNAFSYFLSILGMNVAFLHGQSLKIGNYRIYATMNPNEGDAGTNSIPPPMLDRFALMIPFPKVPSYESEAILHRPDCEQGGESHQQDVLKLLIRQYGLEKDELELLPDIAAAVVKIPPNINEAITLLVKDFTVCERADCYDKDMLRETRPPELCRKNNCRYYGKSRFVCYTTQNGLSERACLALKRYAVAVAYIIGQPVVTFEIVKGIAKMMFAPRLLPVGDLYENNFFQTQLYRYMEEIIDRSIDITRSDRQEFIRIRDDALRSGNIMALDIAIKKISANFDDPLKYDFLKSLERAKNEINTLDPTIFDEVRS